MAKIAQIEQAASLDAAAKKLSIFASSHPLQARQFAEDTYGRLYQKLVKRGEVQQIKKKYRKVY